MKWLKNGSLVACAVILACCGVGGGWYLYGTWREATMKTEATAELNRLRVPAAWSRDRYGDSYDEPSFELGPYATISRNYDSIADQPEQLAQEADQAARHAGWKPVSDVPKGPLASESCSSTTHRCWSKHEFLLMFNAYVYSYTPGRDGWPDMPCRTTPSEACTSTTNFEFDITYDP